MLSSTARKVPTMVLITTVDTANSTFQMNTGIRALPALSRMSRKFRKPTKPKSL